MRENRRNFIKTSIAFGTLTVTKVIAQTGFLAAASKKEIGFLVSTNDRAKHDSAFQQALSDKGWDNSNVQVFTLQAKDDYNVSSNTTLKTLANQHIANKVDLIVAAGGLPTATAVASAITASVNGGNKPPPFIFLVGRYPASDTGIDAYAASLYDCSRTYKVGGVDQAVPAQNGPNFRQLQTASRGSVTLDTVGLIVNDNNPITAPETDAWSRLKDPADASKSTNSTFVYHITTTDGNTSQGISNLLAKIRSAKPQPSGIVVSSDAFLREVGNNNFDAQLRDTGANGGQFEGWVCYPYEEYALASGKNSIWSATTPVLGTDDPTDPMAAYYILGLTAATVLNQILSGTPSPQNAGLTTWNGATWGSPDLMFH